MNKIEGHILIVDDDDGIRDLVKQYLLENNFLISTAINAEDAKKKTDLVKFDLIVLGYKEKYEEYACNSTIIDPILWVQWKLIPLVVLTQEHGKVLKLPTPAVSLGSMIEVALK